MYVCMYICLYVSSLTATVHMYVCMYACMYQSRAVYVCTCVCNMCVYTHTMIETYIYSNMHSNKQTFDNFQEYHPHLLHLFAQTYVCMYVNMPVCIKPYCACMCVCVICVCVYTQTMIETYIYSNLHSNKQTFEYLSRISSTFAACICTQI